MRRITSLISATLIIGCCGLSLARACGDKLAAIGGGIRFERLLRAEHPGHLILFLSPNSQLSRADQDLQLAYWLRRAGHDVKVVGDRAGLDDALIGSPRADLLLLDVDGARELAGAAAKSKAAVLPVLYLPTPDDLASARKSGTCYVQANRRQQYQFVQAIDHIVAHDRLAATGECVVN